MADMEHNRQEDVRHRGLRAFFQTTTEDEQNGKLQQLRPTGRGG